MDDIANLAVVVVFAIVIWGASLKIRADRLGAKSLERIAVALEGYNGRSPAGNH